MRILIPIALSALSIIELTFVACSKKSDRVTAPVAQQAATAITDTTKFQEFDIIFQASTSGQGKAIQIATRSQYSHMGLIYILNGRYYVYEAIQPVTLTRLEDWIKRGDGGHYVVKRLANSTIVLTQENREKMKKLGERFKNKNYDQYFEWSDDRVYCSELVYKIYQESLGIEIGEMQKLRTFDLSSPIVKAKMKERYGTKIPFEEPVISPGAMFASDKLITVAQH